MIVKIGATFIFMVKTIKNRQKDVFWVYFIKYWKIQKMF